MVHNKIPILARILRTPINRKAALLEAAAVLMLARLLKMVPMRIYLQACGGAMWDVDRALLPDQQHTACEVGKLVRRVARTLPFKAVCIEQTIAASLMLRWRDIPATAYIGVHRAPELRVANPRGYNAHAWLKVGSHVIIGGPDVSDFVPLAKFG